MRLRTAESFFLLKNGLLHTYPKLQKNLTCDIIVVGAGITGALVSHALRQSGYSVIVIDKRDVGFGSTSATTAMIQYEIDTPLYKLEEQIGFDNAADCYLAGIKAIQSLQKLINDEKLDCGFKRKNSLYVSHSTKTNKELHQELLARKKAGIRVKWLNEGFIKKKYKLQAKAGILSEYGASLDAYRLTQALFFKNISQNKNSIRVFDQTKIKTINSNSKKVKITTEDGYEITSKKIIYCTGFEAAEMIKEKIVDLFDTYACVSEPTSRLPKDLLHTLIWEMADPYYYMRTTDDGRILIGGEDSKFRLGLIREKLKEYKSSKLKKRFEEIFPSYEFVEDFTWAGTFGQTKDGLPYIGQSPEHQNAYFVLGFGGNGITFSVQAMEILPKLLSGQAHPLAALYRFGR